MCLSVRAVLWTAFSPLRPTYSASCMSPGTTLQSYGPSPLRYDVLNTVLVSMVGHCCPTDRLLSVTTSSTPCRSPGGTLQSYGPPPRRYDVLNTVQVSRWDSAVLRTASSPFYGFLNTVQVSKRDIEPRSCVKVEVDVLGSCP